MKSTLPGYDIIYKNIITNPDNSLPPGTVEAVIDLVNYAKKLDACLLHAEGLLKHDDDGQSIASLVRAALTATNRADFTDATMCFLAAYGLIERRDGQRHAGKNTEDASDDAYHHCETCGKPQSHTDWICPCCKSCEGCCDSKKTSWCIRFGGWIDEV